MAAFDSGHATGVAAVGLGAGIEGIRSIERDDEGR
jgi:hypothetical protein